MTTRNEADRVYGDGTLPEDADLTASSAAVAQPLEGDIASPRHENDDEDPRKGTPRSDQAAEEAIEEIDRDRAERHD